MNREHLFFSPPLLQRSKSHRRYVHPFIDRGGEYL